MIDPKQLAQTSLSGLEEAVLTILFIEHPRYLEPEEIANRLCIERDYRFKGRVYPVIGGLLYKLKRAGRVERDKYSYTKWRLAESEIKARSS